MTAVDMFVFVATGAKNARYTLRIGRAVNGFFFDHYIRNLSDDQDKAEKLAYEYFLELKERMKDTNANIRFDGVYEDAIKRRGKLSVRDTLAIESIEDGVMPFGKNKGKDIVELEDNTLIYWADQLDKTDSPVIGVLATACMNLVIERGLYAKRDAIRAERMEADKKSEYVGEVGQRLTFTGVVEVRFSNENYTITKIRTKDDNLIVFFGNAMDVERGEEVTFKATVKRHNDYQGVKSTVVNRPKAEEK